MSGCTDWDRSGPCCAHTNVTEHTITVTVLILEDNCHVKITGVLLAAVSVI